MVDPNDGVDEEVTAAVIAPTRAVVDVEVDVVAGPTLGRVVRGIVGSTAVAVTVVGGTVVGASVVGGSVVVVVVVVVA